MSGTAPAAPAARLPAQYTDAGVRCVLPVCPVRGRFGLALDVPGQPPMRLALTPEAAQFLRACLDDYVQSPAGIQSPMSSLMSSSPRSVPSDGEVV